MSTAAEMPEVGVALAGAVVTCLEVARTGGVAPSVFLSQFVRAAIDCRSLPVDPTVLRLLSVDDQDPDVAIVATVLALPPVVQVEDLLGQLHEALLGLDHRYAKGVYYTPVDVAAHVVGLVEGALTAAGRREMPPTACDPAMGGGAFLLAVARVLEAVGWSRQAIVEDALWGLDIDPLAVAVAEAALVLWAAAAGESVTRTNLIVGDTLLCGRELFEQHGAPPVGFDAVVGNPPFQNQLGRGTARDADMSARLRERFGRHVAWRYTDTAALFLLESCRVARPGGRVALVVPQSVLVSGDARGVRNEVLDLGTVEHLWVAQEQVFAASVRVCVPVVRRESDTPTEATVSVSRSRSRGFTPFGDVTVSMAGLRAASTWGVLVGDLFGAPLVELAGTETLASFCDATAGFRDQYYGLAPFVREAVADEAALAIERLGRRHQDEPVVRGERDRLEGIALLMTCGLIDPARCRWGGQPTKFARQRWSMPVVDLDALAEGDVTLAAWTAGRLVPKLVVSTQTRVIEAAVDTRGDWFPSVPTIALSARPDRLWHAAAVVMAPAVTAWLMGRHAGAALSNDAIKVSARQLLEVPLPPDTAAWDSAVAPLQVASAATDGSGWRHAMEVFGECMRRAYVSDDELLAWWLNRLPPWR